MKTPLPRILFAGAAALALSFVVVFAEESEAKKEKGPSKADLQKFDANKDGHLDETEAAAAKAAKDAARQERLDKYDANKDGKINKDEKATEKAEKAAAREAKKAEREKEKSK